MKKWLFAAIALALNSFGAIAQQNTKPLVHFIPGDGPSAGLVSATKLNSMVDIVNSLTGNGGTSGITNKGYFSLNTGNGPTALSNTVIQAVGANAAGSRIELDAFGGVPIVSVTRFDGTKATHTAILSTEQLGSFNYHGSSTATLTYGPSANMAAYATENWSSTAGGTKLTFGTTPNTTHTLTTALTIDQDQSSNFAGQLRTTFGTPAIASGACGATTNGVITSGNNQAGLVTIGSATTTTCTVSFSATLANAPNACVVFPASSGAAATGTTVARVSSVTTSQFVITGSALASTAYYYLCI